MPGSLELSCLILAQVAEKAPPAQPAAPGADPLLLVIQFLPILLLFYFLMIRPQQQQEKRRRAMLEALKKNDRVVTSGGIYGTVVSIDADHDRAVLRVDDEKGVRLTISRSSIVRVLGDPERVADKPIAEKSAASTHAS
ncbi:MAG: hypothetical protein KatS3mg108_3191 [Isosphaeraceae bacterium]|jgi:preprotein translocase subunit YajC|nr:MAG: hypothetical protein KatS3mg108_3191 [Isosphaeraceae bacterium]